MKTLPVLLLILLSATPPAFSQSAPFTYQGRFTQNGTSFSGVAEMQFTLWDAESGGTQLAMTIPASQSVNVSNGLFTANVDFTSLPFTGVERWLQINARTALGTFVPLTPRQKMTAAPYAIHAGSVNAAGITGPIADNQLSGNIALLNANQIFTGNNLNYSVGVGDSSPQQQLSVGSGVVIDQNNQNSGTIASALTFGFSTGEGIGSRRTPGVNQYGLDFYTSSANRMAILNNGSVGLGTANPATKLHLYSTDNPTTFRIQSTGQPGLGRIEFVSDPQGSGTEWRPAYIQSLDNGNFTGGLAFFVNGRGGGDAFGNKEVMRMVNGAVGIGTNNPQATLHVHGNILAGGDICANGGFNCASDRNIKAGFEPADPKAILEKVAALPITRWHYTNAVSTPHFGPMAQDFHAAFGLGTDDKHIATVDADGVALAAIQGLNQKVEEENRALRAALSAKDGEIAELKRGVAELRQLIGNR